MFRQMAVDLYHWVTRNIFTSVIYMRFAINIMSFLMAICLYSFVTGYTILKLLSHRYYGYGALFWLVAIIYVNHSTYWYIKQYSYSTTGCIFNASLHARRLILHYSTSLESNYLISYVSVIEFHVDAQQFIDNKLTATITLTIYNSVKLT